MRNILFSLPKRSLGQGGRAVLIFLSLSFLLAACSFGFSYGRQPRPQPITPVNDWLYRSGQVKGEGFHKLRELGIRTVVNFRNEPEWIEWEKKIVEGLGIKYVSLPWSITRDVKPELLDQLFRVLDDPKNRPVLIHCKHGRDRTGVMTTLALMRYGKLPEDFAREEAIETIRPNFRYRIFVNEKIDFFIRKRQALLSETPASGHGALKPAQSASG